MFSLILQESIHTDIYIPFIVGSHLNTWNLCMLATVSFAPLQPRHCRADAVFLGQFTLTSEGDFAKYILKLFFWPMHYQGLLIYFSHSKSSPMSSVLHRPLTILWLICFYFSFSIKWVFFYDKNFVFISLASDLHYTWYREEFCMTLKICKSPLYFVFLIF